MFHNCKEPSSLPIKICHHVPPTSGSMLDSSQAVKHIIKQLTEEEKKLQCTEPYLVEVSVRVHETGWGEGIPKQKLSNWLHLCT
jgi:hypothetical protein